jgi:hypothetical protein
VLALRWIDAPWPVEAVQIHRLRHCHHGGRWEAARLWPRQATSLVHDSSSSSSRALHEVVSQAVFLPCMRTDCHALVATAAAGVSKATSPKRVLAGIWNLIARALDGDISRLANHRVLVWMPAHKGARAIGEAKRSDGQRLSHIDWRANRLVDGLAKQAAEANQAAQMTLSLLESAREATWHAAKLLGRVTFASNNHPVHSLNAEGKAITRLARDSIDAPKRPKVHAETRKAKPPGPPKLETSGGKQVQPWQPPVRETAAAAKKAAQRAGDRATVAQGFVARRVEQIGAASTTREDRPTGAQRLQALKARVRGREGGGGDSTAASPEGGPGELASI